MGLNPDPVRVRYFYISGTAQGTNQAFCNTAEIYNRMWVWATNLLLNSCLGS